MNNYARTDYPSTILTISNFQSVWDIKPTRQIITVRELYGQLSLFNSTTREERDNLPTWTGAIFAPGMTRCNDAVIAITTAALDLDENVTLEDVEDKVEGYECCIHTTFSHSLETPRLRVVFPLSKNIKAGDWPDRWDRLYQMFDGRLDTSTKDLQQPYFYPQHSDANKDIYFCRTYSGQLMDVDTLPEVRVTNTHQRQLKLVLTP